MMTDGGIDAEPRREMTCGFVLVSNATIEKKQFLAIFARTFESMLDSGSRER